MKAKQKKGGYDIRLRNLQLNDQKELAAIQSFLRSKEGKRVTVVTDVVLILIRRFLSDQKSIEQLQKRNTELHRAINHYYGKEGAMRNIIVNAVRNFDTAKKQAAAMVRHFTPKKKRT